jgi:hypothetical protein
MLPMPVLNLMIGNITSWRERIARTFHQFSSGDTIEGLKTWRRTKN